MQPWVSIALVAGVAMLALRGRYRHVRRPPTTGSQTIIPSGTQVTNLVLRSASLQDEFGQDIALGQEGVALAAFIPVCPGSAVTVDLPTDTKNISVSAEVETLLVDGVLEILIDPTSTQGTVETATVWSDQEYRIHMIVDSSVC